MTTKVQTNDDPALELKAGEERIKKQEEETAAELKALEKEQAEMEAKLQGEVAEAEKAVEKEMAAQEEAEAKIAEEEAPVVEDEGDVKETPTKDSIMKLSEKNLVKLANSLGIKAKVSDKKSNTQKKVLAYYNL